MEYSLQFIQHLRKFVPVDAHEKPVILSYFDLLHFKKKTMLMEAGQVCRHHYYVAKGCLRMFFVDDEGNEHTVQFAIENWWMTDHSTFNSKGSSDFFIQAVEPVTVYVIDFASQERLFKKVPQMERYFRLIYQKAYAASQLRMKSRYIYSDQEVYLRFKKNFPEFVKRVPQRMLASFLGITPEYLSTIKKKHS